MKGSCPIITALRERMSKASISALIVPSADSHNSEYVAEQFQRRAFLTQFSGSAGTAVITLDKALLWTDGRYWLEAGSTMYTDFELMKQGKVGVPNVEDWLALHLDSKERVGLFPEVCTIGQWETYAKKIPLQPVEDFVGAMMPPNNTPNLIFERPAQFCGATCMERREALVKKLKESKCDHLLLSALDEVAWLTNLRGSDVPYNPVFYAYALVSAHHPKVKVFVDLRKVTAQVRDTCTSTIDFLPYEAMTSELVSLASAPIGVQPPSFLVDERQTSEAVRQILERAGAVIRRVDCGPAQSLKAVKNEVELDGFRKCHVRDGASLTRYLAWLHEEIAVKGVTTLNEYNAATKLEEYRSVNEHYVQLSFPTISSSGPNAAVVHYQPEPQGSRLLAREELYLVDSGAQYLDGTTDVTRTVCFAPATEFQKEAYTRVLQGHIGLDLSVFPEDLNGVRLDMVARQALWNVGLDYAHGTGHGVGSFLNVHEGPHGVGIRPSAAGIAACSIISNEPGYYKDGEFGIRIENLDEIVPRPTKYSSAGFLGLRYLTMAPLCRELILAEMLTGEQRQWVNTYHATVKERLLPLLRDQWKDDRAVEYLNHHTTPI